MLGKKSNTMRDKFMKRSRRHNRIQGERKKRLFTSIQESGKYKNGREAKLGMDQENVQFKVQRWELLWPLGKTGRTGAWGNVVESHEAGRRSWTVVLGSKGPCKGRERGRGGSPTTGGCHGGRAAREEPGV